MAQKETDLSCHIRVDERTYHALLVRKAQLRKRTISAVISELLDQAEANA